VGIAVDTKNRNSTWNWIINIHDRQPGISDDYALVTVEYVEDHCLVPPNEHKNITYYSVLFETIKLIAFPDSKNEMWYKYNDTGLFRFADSGLIDTRLNSIIEVKEMKVILHDYLTDNETILDLAEQVKIFRVDRPLAVRPSIVIFIISFIIIIILVVSEVATQRRNRMAMMKSRKNDELELKDSLLMEQSINLDNYADEQQIDLDNYADEVRVTEIR